MTGKTESFLKHLLTHNKAKSILDDQEYPYILITCSHTEGEGDVDVELSYDGSKDLLGYVMNQVGDYFEEESHPALIKKG